MIPPILNIYNQDIILYSIITKRLKARPAERQTDSDDFIKSQHEYSAWFKRSRGKFQLFIDNTNQTLEETAGLIEDFIKSL